MKTRIIESSHWWRKIRLFSGRLRRQSLLTLQTPVAVQGECLVFALELVLLPQTRDAVELQTSAFSQVKVRLLRLLEARITQAVIQHVLLRVHT